MEELPVIGNRTGEIGTVVSIWDSMDTEEQEELIDALADAADSYFLRAILGPFA